MYRCSRWCFYSIFMKERNGRNLWETSEKGMREIKGRVLSVSPAVAGGVFLKKGGGTREAVRLGGRQGELLPCLSFRHPLCRRQLCR